MQILNNRFFAKIMFYKIAPLHISPNKKSNSVSEVFISQVDAEKENNFGKLFVCLEIKSKNKKKYNKIIDFIINKLFNNYYQNEKLLINPKIKLKTELIFEASLTKLNKNFIDFVNQEKIKINYQKINITAGVVYENNIHFANTGTNQVLLIYKNKQDEYKISNLNEQSPHNIKKPNKLFDNVISGNIPEKGSFVIANETISEYLPKQQLIETVNALPPIGASEQLRNILQDINKYISFLAIIIKNTSNSKPINKQEIQKSVKDSIVNLNNTENETKNLLSPRGIVNFNKLSKTKKIFNQQNTTTNTVKQSNHPKLPLKDKIFSRKRQNILYSIKTNLLNLNKVIILLIKYLFKKEKIKTADKSGIVTTKKTLNFKKKILIGIFISALALLTFNISVTRIEKHEAERKLAYETMLKDIEQKQNKLEAKLLYSNNDGIQELLTEIENLLKTMPQETQEQKNNYQKFQEKLEKNLEKIRKVTKLKELTKLTDLKNINKETKPQNIILTDDAENIYIADAQNKTIYSLNIKSNATTISTEINENQILASPDIYNENFIFYLGDKKITNFDMKNETYENLEIDIDAKDLNTAKIDIYNNRLYVLNNEKKYLKRFNKQNQSFGSPYNWIQDGTELNDTIDLAIDGHIYILTKNAEVLKFLHGEKVDFKLEQIDPILTNPQKIKISKELDFIYILGNNRLLVFDKEGGFITQYMSDELNNLIDFVVDDEKNVLYFLNGTEILAQKGSHY